MKLHVALDLLKRTFQAWNDDNAPRLGAALAYYSIFSIAPLLILLMAIIGHILGKQVAQGALETSLRDAVGAPMAHAMEGWVREACDPQASTLATLAGIITLLFGATGVFGELHNALNTIWKSTSTPEQDRPWIWNLVRERFLAFVMVLCTGLVLLASLVVSTSLATLQSHLTFRALSNHFHLWQALNVIVSFSFIMLMFALIFKILPDVWIAWSDVWVGAAVTALLFTIGKYLLSIYLGWSGTKSLYGAAGSLVIVLLWVYYSSQVFLLGAEFTRIYSLYRKGE